FGQGMSVKRDSPVEVLNARNSRPAGASESKSMISRWKSSDAGALAAARGNAKAAVGGGLAIGSKPIFLSSHFRSTRMVCSPGVLRQIGFQGMMQPCITLDIAEPPSLILCVKAWRVRL